MDKSFLKYPGGQWYNRKWIVSHLPHGYEDMIYLEPYLGAGAVLLAKNPSKFEKCSDLNKPLIDLWNDVRMTPRTLQQNLMAIEYNEENFNKALAHQFSPSINEFVLRRMSRGAYGKSFAESNRLRGGQMGDKNAWDNAILNIPKVHERVKDVRFHNCKALSLLSQFDVKVTNNPYLEITAYLDPPFPQETRKSKQVYGEFEMSTSDHVELLDFINGFSGRVLLSSYENQLYTDKLQNWNKVTKEVVNHSGQTKRKNKRINVLWKNY